MIFLSCYNLIKNNCDGRCQGCGNCPICDAYHSETIPRKDINRLNIIKYAIKSKIENIKWNVFLMTKNGIQLKKEIKTLIKRYKNETI